MSAQAIRVRDLHKRYGRTEAVRGVGFDVAPGEIFGLLGPNGAGKTTTLECLVGLREPDAGTVEVAGLDARRQPRAVREVLGVALQSTFLQDKITPREALRLFASFYRTAEAPERGLSRFALESKADAPFDSLSGGQRQRLALALAFVHQPKVVVLDEPTTGLDPQARHDLHGEIRRMKDEGCTVLLSTHDLGEAASLCDRLAIIDRGRVVAEGRPPDLMAAGGGPQVLHVVFSRNVTPVELAEIAELSDTRVDQDRVSARVADATAAVEATARWARTRGLSIRELQLRRASLEDVFLRLTEK